MRLYTCQYVLLIKQYAIDCDVNGRPMSAGLQCILVKQIELYHVLFMSRPCGVRKQIIFSIIPALADVACNACEHS